MGNRIIKESICTSEDIDRLSPRAETLFYRLMVKADDHGTYYGNERIIKSTCFPLKDINTNMVRTWIQELIAAGLVYLYEAEDGRWYLQFTKWEKHQQLRAAKRKYPACTNICGILKSSDINCNQMKSDDISCSPNPIQSKPIRIQSEYESNPNPIYDDVVRYAKEKNLEHVDVDEFFKHYESVNWTDKEGKPIKDWKRVLNACERSEKDRLSGDTETGSAKERWNVRYDNE